MHLYGWWPDLQTRETAGVIMGDKWANCVGVWHRDSVRERWHPTESVNVARAQRTEAEVTKRQSFQSVIWCDSRMIAFSRRFRPVAGLFSMIKVTE